MVLVRMPPPIGGIVPQYVTFSKGEELIRIFDPTRYGATATNFRNYGPISRFDHQRCDPAPPKGARERAPRHREYSNNIDPERSVIYVGRTFSCCLVEIFGDGGVIAIEKQQVAYLTLTSKIKLLDLRGSGAMEAGTVAAISSITQRDISQAWGKYFYENLQLYGEIDGLIFTGAHNGEDAIMLYERAKPKMESARVEVLNLNHPDLVAPILEIAEVHGLLIR